MSGTVTLQGLVSNTDWSKLIDDMMNAKKAATINPLTNSQAKYKAKLSAWQSLNTTLSTIYSNIENNRLNSDDGYKLYTSALTASDASVTPANVLSVSLGKVSGPGSYSLEVLNLAQSQKVSSDQIASNITAMGLSGDLVINGHVVSISGTDTLSNIAGKINNAGTGVTATVVAVSASDFRLTLQSDATGAAGMSLKNGGSSGILESLGIHTAVESLVHASGSDGLSDAYTSNTSVVGTMLGLSAPQAGTISIKGQSYNINLATDSLTAIAATINADPPSGVTASVESAAANGKTVYQLKLTNIAASDLTDQNNVLETLGLVTGGTKNSLQTGQDASLKIDGTFTVTSSSNTVTNVLDGVTLNLKGTNVGADKAIKLTISQDNSQVAQKVSGLVGNINSALSYIKDQSAYNSDSTKPLFGDINLTLIKSNITDAIYTEIAGNSVYKRASDIGIAFQKDGTITLDTNTLTTALSTNSTEVVNVLRTVSDKLSDNLHLYIDPTSGSLTYMTKSIQESISGIDKKITELNERYDKERVVLENKFNALETLIAQSTLTKNWLTQQVNAMMKNNRQ